MTYCVNCGQEITNEARFCSGCGMPVVGNTANNERRTVYEGELHKCPNCGERVDAFMTKCSACGHEFRDTKVSGVVCEFAQKIEALERQRTEKSKKQKNETAISKTDQQIITLIRSFPIPNTKEDLFEFLIMASSNIDMQRHYDIDGVDEDRQAISDAWEAKFEQAYNKAKLSFSREPEFREMDAIYKQKTEEIDKAKKKKVLMSVLVWGGMIVAILAGFILLFGLVNSENQKVEAENIRLEAIVEEVNTALADENYTLARAKAALLTFSGPNTTSADKAVAKWDVTRAQLMETIDRAEYGADYILEAKELSVSLSQDDFKDKDYLEVKQQLENCGFTNIKTEAINDLITGIWTSEGAVEKVTVNGEVGFTGSSTYLADAEIVIFYHALKEDSDETDVVNNSDSINTDSANEASTSASISQETPETISVTIEKGVVYTYGHDEWGLYCATAISDTVIKIEKWGKALSTEKEFDLKYEVGAIKITDAEQGFSWIDEEHTAFVILLQDQKDSDFKKAQSITFTISGTDSDTNKGTNYDKKGVCYSYQNDDWHLYRAVPLTDTTLKIECWYRSLSIGSFNYGYDVAVIDLSDTETDFEWSDDEHTAFTITMQDKQNSNLKKAKLIAFTLDN
ncbi:MAG: zinc ribbon domain-containing protein [Lachnospiraceae bacterium]|nr:zinc ribbon domain-containing protein [Lachnospiraceae bacterium]